MNSYPKAFIELVQQYPNLVYNAKEIILDREIIKSSGPRSWIGQLNNDEKKYIITEAIMENFGEKDVEIFVRQVNCMAKCNHRYINQIIGFTIEPPYYIITNSFPNGNLRANLFNNKVRALSGTHLSSIAMSISHAMKHFHSNFFMHRSLCIENIQMDEKKMPVIDGFLNCRVCDDEACLTTKIGPFTNMAPEIAFTSGYTNKVDVYSFAFVLFEMAEGFHPYLGKSPSEMLNILKDPKSRPVFTNSTPEVLQELISSCWNQDPKMRPTFEDIFSLFSKGKVFFAKSDINRISVLAEKLDSVYKIRENENPIPRFEVSTLLKKLSYGVTETEKSPNDKTDSPSKLNERNIEANGIGNPLPIAYYYDNVDSIDQNQLDIDKKLLSNALSPKFIEYLRELSKKVNSSNAKQFYDATSQFLTPKNNRSIRLEAFQIYYMVMYKCRKLIDVCYDSQLYFNLPMTDSELIENSFNLLFVLFRYRPTVITSEMNQIITAFAYKNPKNIALILGYMAKDLPPVSKSLPLLDHFIGMYQIYINDSTSSPYYLRFWSDLVGRNRIIHKLFYQKLCRIVIEFLHVNDTHILDEAYCLAISLGVPQQLFDFELIIKHLELDESIDPIFSLLLRFDHLPIDQKMASILIKWAQNNETAYLVLLKFVGIGKEACLLVAKDPQWMKDGFYSIVATFRMLLYIISYHEVQNCIVENYSFVYLLADLIRTADPFVLAAVGRIIVLETNISMFFNEVVNKGVLGLYFSSVSQSNEESVLASSIIALDSLARIGYSKDFNIMLNKMVELLYLRNSISPSVIATFVTLSYLKEMKESIQALHLNQYFASLLSLSEYRPYAEAFLANMR